MGLGNLRDRVGGMDGTLEVQSVVGEGTTVVATIPL